MASLGEGHFCTTIETLPGESILWEDGPAKRGYVLNGARAVLLIVVLILLLVGAIALLESSDRKGPASNATAAETAQEAPAPTTPAQEAGATLTNNTKGQSKFLGLLVIGLLALVAIAVAEACLSWRNSWYVVTNERICIQAGVLTKCLKVIDIDKILSVQVSTSWLERRAGLQSIELLHAGMRLLTSNRTLVRDRLVMTFVPAGGSLVSDLLNSWLPRDNRARGA